MNIAMLGWEYPPFKVGGLGTHCYGLTRSLAAKGVAIDFYMPKTRQRMQTTEGNLVIKEVGETEIFPYDRPDAKELAGQFFESVYRYNDLLVHQVKGRYSLVHGHDWLTMNAGVRLKEKLGVPFVVTVHSTEYDRSGWRYPNQWFIDIEREGMMNADWIIAVSEFTKKTLVERYGVPPGKITVVHNAVDPIGPGEKQKIVLFLGRLTIQKGPVFFLRAAKKVLEYEPCRFIVAGTGDMLPGLITEAVCLNIENQVMFTGLLSEDEVRHIYRTACVYVMPSVSEPFGITALEAISAGTPTITSKTAGVSEVFKNCFKVDFWDTDEMANKIISLLRYQPLWDTLAENGRQEIELFTWDRVADRTLAVYTGALL